MQEDCLVLNIHVPLSHSSGSLESDHIDELLPVLFWIHGGAFIIGAGTYEAYDGRFLSNSTNTVVVTSNYRLGKTGRKFDEPGQSPFRYSGGMILVLLINWSSVTLEAFKLYI